ncbi:U3 small nucleolar RNA-associated protein 6, putative [Babesia bigemina]|uniref:U3 small nucleolar RNA-associated protein 6, putative n=1 Tax=Babesia bigemina TaxID=5866 RepID=A0A061D9H7_BABBI|nr:U3 small nucleolar RNA-associated protein 6, putative [Babesia bigemina]CDR97198.1 U3 small nucleolar RNA-associated protein 6, putative [Babesia bigemina]|eukprot:XP_012769384.1 U3 small nucleolar RNA-associated protein 6, putative [Babesia bigemina]
MAARVQHQLEDMVPELRRFSELQLFTESEVQDIVKCRRKYEYAVISTDPVYARNSFREYIRYEVELDRLLQERLRQAKSKEEKSDVRYNVPAEHGKVPIKVTVRRRIHRIFNRCLKRFGTEVELWKEYCAFCYRIKAFNVLNRAIMGALSKNPTCEALWKVATQYTMTLKGSVAARRVVKMALRANPRSLSLFTLLLELEVQVTQRLADYAKSGEDGSPGEVDPEEISTKTWSTIMRHALKSLKGSDIFKMLFFGATVCARVQRAPGFANALGDYGEFSSLVFNEMFNRRLPHPVLGLYVWQHRLLESLLVHRSEPSDACPPPETVFGEMVEDCASSPAMMPVVCRFINVVIASEDDTTPEAGATSGGADEPSWVMDVDGSQPDVTSTNKRSATESAPSESDDPEIDACCGGIDSVKDICFLRPTSDGFESSTQQCEYVRGMIDAKQLRALGALFRKHFAGVVSASASKLGPIALRSQGNDIAEALLSSDDDLLRLVALQVTQSTAKSHSVSGYSLAIEFSRHVDSACLAPFVAMVNRSILHSLRSTHIKESSKSGMLIRLIEWEHLSDAAKIEAARNVSVDLTRQQLLQGVTAAVKLAGSDAHLVEIVVHLLDLSAKVIIDDFTGSGDLVATVFNAVSKRIIDPVGHLRQYRTNNRSSRNAALLCVVISFWQVDCTMSSLKEKLGGNGFGGFTSKRSGASPAAYAKEAREVINLCDAAVMACDSVNVSDVGLKLGLRNRCWQLYVQCAKALEQLDFETMVLNLHSYNFSSDAVAARAYAQLGSAFVTNSV